MAVHPSIHIKPTIHPLAVGEQFIVTFHNLAVCFKDKNEAIMFHNSINTELDPQLLIIAEEFKTADDAIEAYLE